MRLEWLDALGENDEERWRGAGDHVAAVQERTELAGLDGRATDSLCSSLLCRLFGWVLILHCEMAASERVCASDCV